jgi:hypothetical protein
MLSHSWDGMWQNKNKLFKNKEGSKNNKQGK